jgi:transposase
VHFAHGAQEATLVDYLHEVEHVAARIERLERAIDEAVKGAPEQMRAVIEALQALRGIARISAVTIVTEVGELSRFARPRQLMGYSGAVASEDSTGYADSARGDHEDRQRAPPAGRHRSGVGVSASARHRGHPPKTPGPREF